MKTDYRWNCSPTAEDYDAAATSIHPCYTAVQDAVQDAVLAALSLQHTPFKHTEPLHIIDLGGGSARLLERLLGQFPAARATLVEPSAPFRRLAAQRLSHFADRVAYVDSRAEEDWPQLTGPADVIVSTSALHHLDANEKNRAFRLCHQTLTPHGVFINGDEYRPPSDRTYRELLEAWGEHMDSAIAIGTIPASFREVVANWRKRNLDDFGGERKSGDDCHETIEEQTARLYGAKFHKVETTWQDSLWTVLVAHA